jgi:hypothetical protein
LKINKGEANSAAGLRLTTTEVSEEPSGFAFDGTSSIEVLMGGTVLEKAWKMIEIPFLKLEYFTPRGL